MYSSTFIFAKKQFDDDFHRLDQTIAQAARSIPGYAGEETCEYGEKGLGLVHSPQANATADRSA